MLQAYFNGLSGMVAFSKGLNNVSTNVSNMNTVGFRGSDTFFQGIQGDQGQGLGVTAENGGTRTKSGETRQTGNQTDLAIEGNGFFVLKSESGEFFYTRAGTFKFNEQDVLVDRNTNYEVVGSSVNGALGSISVSDLKVDPATPTTKIDLAGVVYSKTVAAGQTPTAQDKKTHEMKGVNYYDLSGKQQKVDLKFSQDTAGNRENWTLDVMDAGGKKIASKTIKFDTAGNSTVDSVEVELDSTRKQKITFSLKDARIEQLTDPSNITSTMKATATDGTPVASTIGYTFNGDGSIDINYSNGKKSVSPQKIVLANFNDQSVLMQETGALYFTNNSDKPLFGEPRQDIFGAIKGGFLEASNVDLAQEFGDILIIQRGYQASSRVMTIANEMIEQLYNASKGG